MNKYDLIIFDLDGVLLNSKENMKTSWNMVRKKFKVKKSFNDYFKFIGYPFFEILKKLLIKENFSKIQTEYNKNSLKNFNKIKLYKDIIQVLRYLNKRKIKFPFYGAALENMIKYAVKQEEGREKEIMTGMIANHMKKSYLLFNKHSVSNDTIILHLNQLSNNILKLPSDFEFIRSSSVINKNPRNYKKKFKKKR